MLQHFATGLAPPTWGDLLRLMIAHSDNRATDAVLGTLAASRPQNTSGAAHGLRATRVVGPLQVDEPRWTAARRPAASRAAPGPQDVAALASGPSGPTGGLPANATERAAATLRGSAFADELLRRVRRDDGWRWGAKGG